MRFASSVPMAVLLFFTTLLGQSPTTTTQVQTFHVKGTITDPLGAVIPRVKVMFENEQLNKTMATNDVGVYEVDLPLGVYAMTALSRGFRPYRRPQFRVTSPTSLTLDVILPIRRIVDRVEVGSWEDPATPEWECAGKDPSYYGDEVFPASPKDGVPFQLYIRYAGRTPTGSTCIYTGEKRPYDDPVFVAYNLFSLQADRVIYNLKLRTIEASGNVVAVNESGAKQHGDKMTLRIENGGAVSIR